MGMASAAAGANSPKQSPQPQLMHISALQRLSQEPNRSYLGAATQPVIPQMPTLNRLGSPYAGMSVQMGPGGAGGEAALGPGPLSHFSPRMGGDQGR